MHISVNDAVKIYARACKARYGRMARKVVLATAQSLRTRGDQEGVRVWEQVANELDHPEAQDVRHPELLEP